MATIITVHGTNDTGPADAVVPGEGQWWQRHSFFDRHIRELVEAEDGDLKVEPHIWDAKNSENSRHSAATYLLKSIKPEGTFTGHKCLVGHSHGGSIISTALAQASARSDKLRDLSGWITVGTPFIKSMKKRLLFSRLGLRGKSLYISILTFLMFAVFLAVFVWPDTLAPQGNINLRSVFSLVILPSMPFVILYLVLLWFNWRSLPVYHQSTYAAFSKDHFVKWTALSHSKDEAILGLLAAKSIRFPIFGEKFAVPIISFVGAVILPFLLLALLASRTAMAIMLAWANDRDPLWWTTFSSAEDSLSPPSPGGILQNLPVLMNLIYHFSRPVTEVLKLELSESQFFYSFVLLIAPTLFLIAGFIIFLTGCLIANLISTALGKTLDRLTWAEIKRSLYGDDRGADIATEVNSCPMWLNRKQHPLPRELADEIENLSNEAAKQSIGKLRSAITQFAFSEDKRSKSDVLSDYLTWKELIHTTYFHVPRFRKLVAYAITQADGFRPTEAFLNDPDYEVVKGWYEEIKSPG